MGLFVRGRLFAEERNPVYRFLVWVYKPVLELALRWRWPVLGATVAILVLTWIPLQRIGSEFMPPLNEGSILYMPMTLPGISVRTAHEAMRRQDSILADFPEVESVFGKAGRANTATDPAPLAMFETTIVLKPEQEWREGVTWESLIREMDEAIRFPGIPNSWTMPIKGRIDMLATGIRTPVGIKIFGPDLVKLERIGREVENAVAMVPGARSAVAERPLGESYLNIEVDRDAAARYGVNIRDANMVIASAIGGMEITQVVDGRERYGVRVRYPQELRESPEDLAEVLVPVRQTRSTPSRVVREMGSGANLMAALGYNWSVATGVGFIALAGVGAETSVIMLLYLNHSWDDRIRSGRRDLSALYEAVMEGAVHRVRPKIMTVTAIIGGLLPILWGHGTGASVMKRIAAPMVGGMLSATVLTLVVVPVIYFIWQGRAVNRVEAGIAESLGSPELGLSPAAGD